jgi:cell division protein FtsI/penicillin-binding protein 2
MDESKSFETLPIRTRLTDEEVARFIAHRYRFPGVEIKARLFRQYPGGAFAAHILGYIGRITDKPTWRRSRSGRKTRTTAAPSTSAKPAWSSAMSSTCMASAAMNRLRWMPAVAPCVRCRARRRWRATS